MTWLTSAVHPGKTTPGESCFRITVNLSKKDPRLLHYLTHAEQWFDLSLLARELELSAKELRRRVASWWGYLDPIPTTKFTAIRRIANARPWWKVADPI